MDWCHRRRPLAQPDASNTVEKWRALVDRAVRADRYRQATSHREERDLPDLNAAMAIFPETVYTAGGGKVYHLSPTCAGLNNANEKIGRRRCEHCLRLAGQLHRRPTTTW